MNRNTRVADDIFPSPAAELRPNWGWLLVLGICLLILGTLAVLDTVLATTVSMLLLGGILLIAGVVEAVQAFRHRHGGHLFLHALNAVLSIVVGAMLLSSPMAGAVIMTLLLAVYFTVAGIFRIVITLRMRTPAWGWALFDGILTLILGILIWADWPFSGLWVVGLFIGIDLIIVGWSRVMVALAVRTLPGKMD